MVRKVCLDSDVIIAFFRKEARAISLIESLEAELCTTSINVFEVWYGKRKHEPVVQFFEYMTIFELGKDEAVKAAELFTALEKTGQSLEFRDIFIAACCIQHDAELITFNKQHFERLKSYGLRMH